MTKSYYRKLNTVLLGAVSGLSLATGAFAQQAATIKPSAQLEEIVVTAEKRGAQSLQTIPISIQAITGEQFRKSGAIEINDFFHQIPGFSVEDQGAGDKRYVIRGIEATGAGTVGIYLDEVVITGGNDQDGGGREPDVKLFDLDRVEVLKGPQGTTFGSSSMAGTIRYITAKPKLDEFEARVTTSVRSTKGAKLGTQVEAMANVPVVKDKFAIRAAGLFLNQPGFINNQFENGANNDNTRAGRVEARAKLAENLTFNAMVMYEKQNADAHDYYNLFDFNGNPLPHFFQADVSHNPWQDTMHMYNATLEYAAPFGTFTGTYSRFTRSFIYDRDSSGVINAFLGLPLTGAGRSVITQPGSTTRNTYEVRFASKWQSPVQILVGGFAQNDDRHFESNVLTTNSYGYIYDGSTSLLGRSVQTSIKEKAVFGEAYIHLTDALKLTVGGRYYDFKMNQIADALVSFGGGPGSGLGAPGSASASGAIGKANLSYNFTPDVMAYAAVSQGYRPGGINDQTAAAIAHVTIPAGFGPDKLVNYEVGAKTSWLNDRLIVNPAAYYIVWSNIQVQNEATSGTSQFPYTANAGGAHIKGVELEIRAKPAPGFDLGLAANYNSAKLSTDAPIPTNGLAGDKIPFVPDWSLAGNAQYTWDTGFHDIIGLAGIDASYTGSRGTTLRPTDPLFTTLNAYWLVNLHGGIQKDDWSLDLAIRNVFNDTSTIGYTDVSLPPYRYFPNTPRTVMVTFSQHF